MKRGLLIVPFVVFASCNDPTQDTEHPQSPAPSNGDSAIDAAIPPSQPAATVTLQSDDILLMTSSVTESHPKPLGVDAQKCFTLALLRSDGSKLPIRDYTGIQGAVIVKDTTIADATWPGDCQNVDSPLGVYGIEAGKTSASIRISQGNIALTTPAAVEVAAPMETQLALAVGPSRSPYDALGYLVRVGHPAKLELGFALGVGSSQTWTGDPVPHLTALALTNPSVATLKGMTVEPNQPGETTLGGSYSGRVIRADVRPVALLVPKSVRLVSSDVVLSGAQTGGDKVRVSWRLPRPQVDFTGESFLIPACYDRTDTNAIVVATKADGTEYPRPFTFVSSLDATSRIKDIASTKGKELCVAAASHGTGGAVVQTCMDDSCVESTVNIDDPKSIALTPRSGLIVWSTALGFPGALCLNDVDVVASFSDGTTQNVGRSLNLTVFPSPANDVNGDHYPHRVEGPSARTDCWLVSTVNVAKWGDKAKFRMRLGGDGAPEVALEAVVAKWTN